MEFEKVSGKRDLSFANAFKMLVPLADDHFLARRFGNGDSLEKEAKEDPVKVIKMILKDLGPKNATEIKNELEVYVIPEGEWTKWWQSAKIRIKKENLIEMPGKLKDPFRLTENLRTVEEKLEGSLEKAIKPKEFIDILYAGLRDHPQISNNSAFCDSIFSRIKKISQTLSEAERLSLLFIQEDMNVSCAKSLIFSLLHECTEIKKLITDLDIIAFKKRVLVLLK